MNAFKTVPRLFGKGIHVWLGLALLGLLPVQAVTGISMAQTGSDLSGLHFFNAAVILSVSAVHVYFGLGLAFFGFRLKR